MSAYDKIPLAKDYRSQSKTQTKKMRDAARSFVDQLLDICQYYIEQQQLQIFINNETIKSQIAGIPADVLLYGHRTEKWTERTPIEELEEMPFITAQRRMHEKGWYLIEISDPEHKRENSKSSSKNNVVLKLYRNRPPTENKYFNKVGLLWHGNNMFPEEEKEKEES